MTDSVLLRQYLGEAIPAGGSATDTFFTDAEIQDLLDRNPTLNAAAAEGWEIKASNYSNLVNVSEGGASRSMSDLSKQALAMLEHYQVLAHAETPSAQSSTRIKTLRRS